MICPKCRMPALGRVDWGEARPVHLLDQDALLIASRHTCLRCPAKSKNKPNTKQNRCFRFCAASSEAIALMREYVRLAWVLHRMNRQTLCDDSFVDTTRAWATRASWAAITAALNELRDTRKAKLEQKYIALCNELRLIPTAACSKSAQLTSRMVTDIYDADYNSRMSDTMSEILAEAPGDILSIDWTKDSAARCGAKWLFNAMDSDGKILASILTATTSPLEVEPVMQELRKRGLELKALYVDDGCCGAWKDIIAAI